MKWIIDDIKEAWAELHRRETWLVIGLLVAFSVVTFLIVRFAFRTDAMLSYLGVAGGPCRQMTNTTIIAVFSAMVFFALTAVLTLGEIQQHLAAKRHGARHLAAKSKRWAIVWATVAFSLAAGTLTYFTKSCY